MSDKPVKVGSRVQVSGKDVLGTVAYIGTTQFSSGKWIGVVLDEQKGKNNGVVQGKRYFTCDENYGIFVRQSQITDVLDEDPDHQTAAPKAADAERKKVNRLSGIRPPSSIGKISESRSSPSSTPKSISPASSEASLPGPTDKGGDLNVQDASKVIDSPKSEGTTLKPSEISTGQRTEKRHSLIKTPGRIEAEKLLSSSQVSASDMKLSQSIEDKMSDIQQAQETQNLKDEIRDLEEKLETLRIKRMDDKTKLKEFEKTKIQLRQLQEVKLRQQEALSDLQRQLQKSQNEQRDISEAFNRYKDEMADLAETVELATLDKEMAEEKSESLQTEVDGLKEKVEELNLDLEILKGEIAESGTEGVAANFEMKQLEQQNERLKEALVKMRDLSNTEKQDAVQMKKQLEKYMSDNNVAVKEKERTQSDLNDMQNQMMELKDQVDAALGAEEMVEQLTERNLKLEERIKEVEEEKADLEALCDMNEELQESAREMELELREEIDLAAGKIAESQRKYEGAQESLADYETTIAKFRELVCKLQEDNRSLRETSIDVNKDKVATPTLEMFDFKAKFAETKANAKAIDMELRKLEVDQATSHVQYLMSFMPNSFTRRGGDNDAVLTVLLIPRLVCKSELLLRQIRERFQIPDVIDKDDVKTNRADQFSYANRAMYSICVLQTSLHQYESALSSCTVDQFLKIGTLLPELAVNEKPLDSLIELLRKDQLDDTVSLENLEKSIAFFQHLHSVHLAAERIDCSAMMSDICKCLLSGCSTALFDLQRIKLLSAAGGELADISILLRDFEKMLTETQQQTKVIKRRLPSAIDSSMAPLSFSKEVQDELQKLGTQLWLVVRTLHELADMCMQKSVTSYGEGLSTKALDELAESATDNVYERETSGPYKCLKVSVSIVQTICSKLAVSMENGEYDFDGTREKKSIKPINQRAQMVKNELSDAESLKIKFEDKEEDLKEMKRTLKLKQEEISETQIRLASLEKKMENVGKDGDERMDKVQRRLDEATQQLKKRDKEYEETLDALQADIDALEHEKHELKDRLKVLSKKSLLEGLQRQSGLVSGLGNSGSMPPSSSEGGSCVSSGSLQESTVLLDEMESLRQALYHVKMENSVLQALTGRYQLASLPRIRVPKKQSGVSSQTGDRRLSKLTQNAHDMLNKINSICADVKVADISKRHPGESPSTHNVSPASQLLSQATLTTQVQLEANRLQENVTALLAESRKGGKVKTDFSIFPTTSLSKLIHEKSNVAARRIGTVTVPVTAGHGDNIHLLLDTKQVNYLHGKFTR